MKLFWIGILAGVCLPILAAFLFLASGSMPVATRGGPLPLERQIAGFVLHRAIGHAEDLPSPVPSDERNLVAGAKVYRQQCAVCHGEPGSDATAIAQGMFPPPPQLFEKDGVTDDPVGETFWKVKNGIRLTGMPGFAEGLSTTEMWQVSQLLKNGNQLPASAKAELARKVGR